MVIMFTLGKGFVMKKSYSIMFQPQGVLRSCDRPDPEVLRIGLCAGIGASRYVR